MPRPAAEDRSPGHPALPQDRPVRVRADQVDVTVDVVPD
jgi:hypothetical protein